MGTPAEDAVRFLASLSIRLTPRQEEIVVLLGKGLTNKAIAERLFITDQTVKNHMTNIFQEFTDAGILTGEHSPRSRVSYIAGLAEGMQEGIRVTFQNIPDDRDRAPDPLSRAAAYLLTQGPSEQ